MYLVLNILTVCISIANVSVIKRLNMSEKISDWIQQRLHIATADSNTVSKKCCGILPLWVSGLSKKLIDLQAARSESTSREPAWLLGSNTYQLT